MNKSDINLVPKKKKTPRSVVFGVLLALLLLIVATWAGAYFPDRILKNRESQLSELKSELASYEDIQVVYFGKIQELAMLNQEKRNYEAFLNSKRETLDAFRRIDRAAMTDIIITKYDFSFTQVTLSGTAVNDLVIADFEESLWGTNLFSRIELGTVSGDPGQRRFIFTLIYSDTDGSGGTGS
jgi:hypothetical protein